MQFQHLFFLRHLQTQNNAEDYINGQSINLPILTSNPIVGARDIDTAYCSPALRCRQTMVCFTQTNRVRTTIYSDTLLERNMGKLEGQKRDDMAAQYPDIFDGKNFRVFVTPPGGETFLDFIQRAHSFYNNYLENASGDVLVCSHNQFLKALYFTISNEQISETRWKALNFPFGTVVLL